MKRTAFFSLTLFLIITIFFLANGFSQDYVHYATLIGYTHPVTSVSFSPDGRTLVSGSSAAHRDDNTRLWDITTGKQKKTLIRYMGSTHSVVFSPDGRTLASGSGDGTIHLWDIATGLRKKTFIGHTDIVLSVSFSPNGQTLASGSQDDTIRLWDAVTGRQKKILIGHTDYATSVSFSPDGQTLAAGYGDHTVRLWDPIIGLRKKTLTGHTDVVLSVSFSPDGQTLASGSGDKTIRLWDAITGLPKKTLIGHTNGVTSVSFGPNGKVLVSGSSSLRSYTSDPVNTICLWNVVTGLHEKTLIGHKTWVSSVSFSPDGDTIASGGWDNTIRLWRVSSVRLSGPNPQPTADQVYNNAIRAVMWIVNPNIGEGSGVLIDKQSKLAITNAHVTDKQNTIDVYFPAPDEKGELIKDRNFYLTNSSVLKRLGYYTKGHIVTRNEKTDLAIIKLDGLPETAREIDWNFTTPTTNTGDLVYILGNPSGQDLWRWTLGEFLNDQGDFLHLQSDVFGGNSGGPVLNKQGTLLGIIARSDRHMNALAIPLRDINRLLSESGLEHSRRLR